ncbi:HlyD family secretion protein, partial [Planctomycetota bacterium]
ARARAALKRIQAGARGEERAIVSAEAAVAQSLFEKVKVGARAEERDQAKAALERCAARRRAEERMLARIEKLRTGSVQGATAEELERAEDAVTAARAAEAEAGAAFALVTNGARREDLAIAQRNAEVAAQKKQMVENGAREEDVAAARAELAGAEARAAIADARYEKTLLRAPVNGTVIDIFLNPGESAGPQSPAPVVTVGDTSQLVIRAEVDEHDIARLKKGQRAYARASAFGDRKFHGTVSAVGLRMGRKRLFSDSPRERLDTRVLEALVELDGRPKLPVGFRVDVYVLGED